MAKKKPLQVELANRDVIEDRLLVALTEEDKVAVLLSQREIGLLIEWLDRPVVKSSFPVDRQDFVADLKKLSDAAFGTRFLGT